MKGKYFIIAAIVLIVVAVILIFSYSYYSHISVTRNPCSNTVRIIADKSKWVCLENLLSSQQCSGFQLYPSCGGLVYTGLIPRMFNVSLSVQSHSEEALDERVEFSLFKNREPCPVNDINVPSFTSNILNNSDTSSSITELVRVRHGDSFFVKARYNDGDNRNEDFDIKIDNLKLVFY